MPAQAGIQHWIPAGACPREGGDGDERNVLHVRVQTFIRHGRAMSRPSTTSSVAGKTWMPGIKPGIAVQKDGVLSHAYDAPGVGTASQHPLVPAQAGIYHSIPAGACPREGRDGDKWNVLHSCAPFL